MNVDIKDSKVYQTLPALKSSDADWIKWSDLVMSRYGSNLGRQVFLAAWNKRGGQDANTIAFRKHIKDKYNFEIDESVWNKIADLGGGISDSIGKAFKVGKILFWGTLGFVGLVIIGTGITVMRNPGKLMRG